jgi:hypothetical protein
VLYSSQCSPCVSFLESPTKLLPVREEASSEWTTDFPQSPTSPSVAPLKLLSALRTLQPLHIHLLHLPMTRKQQWCLQHTSTRARTTEDMDDRSSGCLHPQESCATRSSVFSILRTPRTSDKYKVRIQVLNFILLLSPPFLIHCRTCISITTASTFAVLVFRYLILSYAPTSPELVTIHRIIRKNICPYSSCQFACDMPTDVLSDSFVLYQYMRMPY